MFEPILEIFYLHAIFHLDIANTCSAKGNEVRSAIQGYTDIASQSSDVCTLTAYYTQFEFHFFLVKRENFYFIDDENFWL